VDVVVNLAGGPYIQRSAAVLGRGGLLITVRSAGYEADLAEAARQGVRTAMFLVRPDAAGLERLTELVEAGALRVVIDTVHDGGDKRRAGWNGYKEHAMGTAPSGVLP
jgi:NADPH:quinone reductase-like Zn-dependent oxidoreductase